MSVIAEISIAPVGKGESVSAYVARAVGIIKKSGLPFKLGPMGTCIEGEWKDVMAVVTKCMKELQKDCDRVYMTMKVDYRKGGAGRLDKKLRSVKRKL